MNGTPLRALLDRAEGARLLVVGDRDRARPTGMVGGSTRRSLVEIAACPVVVTTPTGTATALPVVRPTGEVR